MKYTFKGAVRRLAVLLSALMVCAMLLPTIALAATNETLHFGSCVTSYQELLSRLEWLRATYVGTYWTNDGQAASSLYDSKYYYGRQCKGFASFIFDNLFCTGFIGSTNSSLYYLTSPSGATEIGRDASVTTAEAQALLSQAKPGDLIQVKRSYSPYNPHTMIVGGVSSDGITILDCNADGKCGVQWYFQTWATFAAKNAGMSLYHSNVYPAISNDTGSSPDTGEDSTDSYIFNDLVFDVDFYRAANAYDLGSMTDDELRAHWKNNGCYEGRRASAAFEAKVYVGLYPDLTAAYSSDYVGAIEHFINYGVSEGRQGSADLNFDCYKANYLDLQNAFGIDNAAYYRHYNVYGYSEGRLANERLKVYFDANGGSVSTSYKEITTGTAYGTLPTPTRDGYKFDGWYTASEGGTLVTSSMIIPTEPFTHRTLYAHWIANECTVTFDPGGLNTVSFETKVVQPGEAYGTLPTASSVFVGVEFAGWYLDDQLITASTIVTCAEDHTLTAGWKGSTITVTFSDSNLPASERTKEVTVGGTYGEMPTPTMEGYTFEGWYCDLNGLVYKVTPTSKVSVQTDHTLYSKYTANTYTVTIDNGYSEPTTKEVAYGSSYFTLLEQSVYEMRPGYTLLGWYTEDGTEVGTTLKIAGDHTIYARWEPNDYTVTFDANGGSVALESKTVTYDAQYGALPTPTRTGYAFIGWFCDGQQITSETTVFKFEDHTLVAEWEQREYTVTFDPMQGSVDTTSKLVLYDALYGELPVPTRVGYSFAGWYTAASGGTEITADTIVSITADCRLYAHWTANQYTVSFNANGGSVDTASKTVTYTAQYGTLPTPTRTGYYFSGWTLESSGGTVVNSTTVCTLTCDHTLYAQWEPVQYTVTLDANGGEGAMAALTKLHDIELTLPESEFTCTEHTFAGWATASDATEAEYLPGDVYTANSKVTLYAVWKANTYTVTFDPNGGTVDSETMQVTYGKTYSTFPSAERTGYSFKGWYFGDPDDSDSVRVYSYDELKVNGDHTLIAKWQIKTCVVAFDSNGGTFSVEALVKTWGVPLEIPDEVPQKDGYVFLGWSLDKKLTTIDYQPGDVLTMEGDVVLILYGVWAEKGTPVLSVQNQATFYAGTIHDLTELVGWTDESLTIDDLTISSSDTSVVRYRSGMLTAYNEGSAVLTVCVSDYPDVIYEIEVRVVDLDLHMFTLPAALRAIEEEAFENSALIAVIVPEKCSSIGARAFADSDALVYIYIPDSVTSIADDAFEGCSDALTLYCSGGAVAEYAERNGIACETVSTPGGW